jgi:hypothetical protein
MDLIGNCLYLNIRTQEREITVGVFKDNAEKMRLLAKSFCEGITPKESSVILWEVA